MTRKSMAMAGALTVVLALVVGALMISGVIPLGRGATRSIPPCEQLPTLAAAQQGLAQHPDIVAALKAVDEGVSVTAVDPCSGQGRGVIRVAFQHDDDEQRITGVLNRAAGFGVPVQLERE